MDDKKRPSKPTRKPRAARKAPVAPPADPGLATVQGVLASSRQPAPVADTSAPEATAVAAVPPRPAGVLMTGFPGFIATRLVERLLSDDPDAGPWIFLVEARFVFAARQVCERLEQRFAGLRGRWTLVEGDIRLPRLGLTEAAWAQIRAEVSRVWHLAAVYDLAVPQALAYAVNVEGTLNVLDLCEELPGLEALLYVSTCYTAGDRTGVVWEDELDRGQGFHNHYESTKFWAEQHVRRRMPALPVVILRPAIVVGDSRTGEIAKADGPYFVMQLLFRLPRLLPMVRLGAMTGPVNLVPVDFVVDAMAALARDPRALGRTFALADPDPMQPFEIMEEMLRILRRAPVIGTVPLGPVLPLLAHPRVRALARVPPEVLTYFNPKASFDVSQTAELLGGTQVRCPRLRDYLPVLMRWARDNPQIFHGGRP